MIPRKKKICKECGKEFGDWHALGGHMRTPRPRKGAQGASAGVAGGSREERVARAVGRLSELSPQEAWQIVVNWIMDVYRQAQLRDELIQTYRLRIQETETKIDAVQRELRELQQMVAAGARLQRER